MPPTLWVYKLVHDSGAAPHVMDGLLSLAICKPMIRNRAEVGDWIFGFGGRSRPVIRGERFIYAARVTGKLARPGEYYDRPEFRRRWDCVYERRNGRLLSRPGAVFHPDNTCSGRDVGEGPTYAKAIVLLSNKFRYLGARGTTDYLDRWPDLGTFVHELGIGQRQVEAESRTGRMLMEMQQRLWKTCDFVGEPTEPSEPPPWSSGPDGDDDDPIDPTRPNRSGASGCPPSPPPKPRRC
ncbi:hypothetical protein [Anaeromyxobacter sp. PSR-1]|uniref:Nmad2 family putative nucleotide modification protein n=1 Tax=Anaeromyxobacter sp. PSR-1 TaxID=1300915 RepID=UPI000A5D493F|nr:hypothetical protein [Anaeromyxobacter sp. PSR-1]